MHSRLLGPASLCALLALAASSPRASPSRYQVTEPGPLETGMQKSPIGRRLAEDTGSATADHLNSYCTADGRFGMRATRTSIPAAMAVGC